MSCIKRWCKSFLDGLAVYVPALLITGIILLLLYICVVATQSFNDYRYKIVEIAEVNNEQVIVMESEGNGRAVVRGDDLLLYRGLEVGDYVELGRTNFYPDVSKVRGVYRQKKAVGGK